VNFKTLKQINQEKVEFYEYSNSTPLLKLGYSDSVLKLKDYNQLPDFIKQNITIIFDISLTEFKSNIIFDEAYITNFENINNDSSFFLRNLTSKTIEPKYELYFTFKDSTLLKSDYKLIMYFDNVGQLLDMNWPREDFNLKENLSNSDTILQIATNYARKHFYNTKDKKWIEIEHDNNKDVIYWKATFYQGIKRRFYKTNRFDYFSIIIDPKTKKIISTYKRRRNLGCYAF
jgi:hypothetical protein